jgi:hypothetical protein
MVHSKSMLVYFNDILEGHSAHWATVASLSALYACEVMAAGDEGRITISLIANLAHLALVLLRSERAV